MGRERGGQLDGGVEEIGRVFGAADGGVFDERRDAVDVEVGRLNQHRQGLFEIGLAIAEIRT